MKGAAAGPDCLFHRWKLLLLRSGACKAWLSLANSWLKTSKSRKAEVSLWSVVTFLSQRCTPHGDLNSMHAVCLRLAESAKMHLTHPGTAACRLFSDAF